MSKYSSRQWLTFSMLALGNVFSACASSLMAPFFPSEAESKGVSPSIYGFIFGIYMLVMCLASPFFGKFITKIGLKTMYNVGTFTSALACISFAFISYINNTNIFIGISFMIRIIAAMGHTAFTCTSFTITAMEFSDNVGSVFGSLGTCFGLGLIIGPLVGGALYEVGGFLLPFIVVGCILMLFTVASTCILPKEKGKNNASEEDKEDAGIMTLLQISSSYLFLYALFAASFCIGYFITGLEVHLRQFHLSPLEVGAIFILEGGFYSLSAPIWGMLTEKILHPILALQIGSIILFASYIIMGPAPFMPISPSLILVIVSLAMYGTGYGAVFVVAFNGLLNVAKDNGFPNNIETQGLVSGIFTSTFSFGFFTGSSVGGILLDNFGFRMGSLVPLVMLFTVSISPMIYMCCQLKSKMYTVKK
ncbi:unnamed protein product, partial [Meganyctiphanes norvegica]|uniref:Major facilitator superfamily (MFS) profile domain-containing protein n=1 Tax=Meganyctiphanes norvegica TaxID=48144 RepID=A0AAV2S5V0_MEGNR